LGGTRRGVVGVYRYEAQPTKIVETKTIILAPIAGIVIVGPPSRNKACVRACA